MEYAFTNAAFEVIFERGEENLRGKFENIQYFVNIAVRRQH